jgi:hypothetical protein
LTLTSYGMVERSRPHGRGVSPVIAMWKDPAKGIREIPLEPGAQGVLLTVCMDRTARRSADGRAPVDNGTHCFDVAVHQVRAGTGSPASKPRQTRRAKPVLQTDELTVLTAWAEAVAEVLAHAPERAPRVMAEAAPGAAWRSALGLPEPSARLATALHSMSMVAREVRPPAGTPLLDAAIAAAAEDRPGEDPLDRMVRQALLSTLEERRTREPS